MLKQVEFGVRKPGTQSHIKCRDYLKSELAKYCDSVELQPFSHTWSRTNESIKMWNVVGTQNWEKAKVRVALFAHWDTRPTADQEDDSANRLKPIPGANDGASGVAVLLELARVMQKANPDLGVMYVLVDGEDLGPGLEEMFLGADYWAKHMPVKKPSYGILLDMIGDKDLAIPVEPNSAMYAKSLVTDFYSHAARIGLSSTFPQQYGDTIEDDHIPLNKAGLPTMDLIDFTYADWHKLTDTPDKCSAASLGKVGTMLQSWLSKNPIYIYRR